jgi:hypothetical protein
MRFHRRGDNTNHLHRCSGSCRTGPRSRSNPGPMRSTFTAEAKWTRAVSSPGLHTGLHGGEAFRAALHATSANGSRNREALG